MSSVTRSAASANYSYNAAGARVQVTLPNGYVESRSYDAAGQVTQIKHSRGASVLAQFDYAYDADGNPTSLTDLSGVETYGYDNRDRLTSVCYQESCPGGSDPFIRWTYDPVGNRLSEARPSGTTNYTYDAADELTQAGSTGYSYDANGNETAADGRGFGWNLAGQLVSTSSGGTTTNYSYDGDGNRLQAAGASTTNYLWDSSWPLPRLAVERDGSGSTLRSYTYGHNLVSMSSAGQNYYFHPDLIGSTRNITSASGQTEWTYSYEPYGTTRTETKNDPMAPDNPVKFAGELSDIDSSLYGFRARQYDPVTGRFLSLDPRPADTASPVEASYAYALNAPTSHTDPSGLGAVVVPDDAQRSAFTLPRSESCRPKYLPPLHGIALKAYIKGYLEACKGLRKLQRDVTQCISPSRLVPSILIIAGGGGFAAFGIKAITNVKNLRTLEEVWHSAAYGTQLIGAGSLLSIFGGMVCFGVLP